MSHLSSISVEMPSAANLLVVFNSKLICEIFSDIFCIKLI